MRQRSSSDKEKHAVFLRRSPRFLPKNHQDSEHPETPEIQPRGIRVPNADSTPLSSNHKISLNKHHGEASKKLTEKSNGSIHSTNSSTGSRRSSKSNNQVECLKEISNKANGKTNGSIISSNSITGSRRSSRLNSRVEDFTPLRRSQRLAEKGSIEKRSFDNIQKRGWIRESCVEKGHRDVVLACPASTNSDKTLNSLEIKSNACVNSSNKSVVKLQKRATRSSCQSQADEGRAQHGGRIGKSSTSKLEKIETCIAQPSLEVATERRDKSEENIDLGEKQRGVKRKRAQLEDGSATAKGWTKEQELALQRAYFAAKATPQFWKKVAKMVPGKSAQECFDRIHVDHLTPPQPRLRSRAKKVGSSLSSPSASKLLQTADANVKKLRCSKLKSHFSQKAVRELLEKQYDIDQDKEADLFSVLESTTDQSSEAFQQAANIATPELKLERLSFLGRCWERSSSAHKEHLSRLSNLSGATLVSPPVLRPIKNKALHNRYIDQLHGREAKRKAASLRTAMHNEDKNDRKGNQDQKVNTIQAAKNALIFDARDAIIQFQNLQTNPSNIFNDGEDDDCDYDDEGVDED